MSEKFLPIDAVGQMIGFGKSFIYSAMKNADLDFPRPVLIGTNVRWVESDVQRWMADQIKKSAQHAQSGDKSKGNI